MSEDEWVRQALTDSTLAAKVLLRLFQPESPPPRSGSSTSQALQLEWSVRQRRSKQSTKKKAERSHASPNTPLSWSGGVSVSGSGSGDGYEESSYPPSNPVDNARSKDATTNKRTPPKRSKRKKTLAELKEEISLHFKENKNLKNELETVKLKFENIRTENEMLSKKLKFEKERAMDESSKRTKVKEFSLDHREREIACDTSEAHNENELLTPDGCSGGQDMEIAITSCNETSFELPDLNLPVEDGPGS